MNDPGYAPQMGIYPQMGVYPQMGIYPQLGYAPQMGVDPFTAAWQGLVSKAGELLPAAGAAAGTALLQDQAIQRQAQQTVMQKAGENIVKNKWVYIGGVAALLVVVYLMAKKG